MNSSLLNIFMALGVTIMVGWLLVVGASILIPIVWAIIAVYVLNRAEKSLARLPILGSVPPWVRKLIVLAIFTVGIVSIVLMTITNVDNIANAMPGYQANLERLVIKFSDLVGMSGTPSWDTVYAATIGKLDFRALLLSALGSLAGLGGLVFAVVLYAAFLMGEAAIFRKKTEIALGDEADRSAHLFEKVNQRIGDYLAVKTLINVILATVSFLIMFAIGVDYAIFWAVLIGLLNYIPYVGSLLGVVFPVLLTLAQFGSIQITLITAVLLTAVQIFVGNVLEPRLIGKSVNLSGFVVLVALVVWTTIWGLHGAILSVPLTSMLVIIMASRPETRFIAIYLSSDGDIDA